MENSPGWLPFVCTTPIQAFLSWYFLDHAFSMIPFLIVKLVIRKLLDFLLCTGTLKDLRFKHLLLVQAKQSHCFVDPVESSFCVREDVFWVFGIMRYAWLTSVRQEFLYLAIALALTMA